MHQAIVIIEYLAILGALAVAWTRTHPAQPPYGAPQAWAGLALLAQGALLLPAYLLTQWLGEEPAQVSARLSAATWGAWGIQLVRAALMVVAITMWLRIAKLRLVRSWRGVVLGIGLLIVILLPDVSITGSLCIVVVLFRLRWTTEVAGWRRFVGFIGAIGLLILMSVSIDAIVTSQGIKTITAEVSDAPSNAVISGELAGPAAETARITAPWDKFIRAASILLRLQLVVMCLQFLVFPIHLRGLSLKWRFTVTMVLYRVIPGILGFAAVVLGVWFGLGLHKARLAQEKFQDTLDLNLRAAQFALEESAGWPRARSDDEVRPVLAEATRLAAMDGGPVFVVLKQAMVAPASAPAGSDTTPGAAAIDTVVRVVATPGTPEPLLRGTLFGAGVEDTVAGMTVADTVLFLGAARAARTDPEAVVAEVYVPIAQGYIDRIAAHLQAEVGLRVAPDISLSEGNISVGKEDSLPAGESFTIIASAGEPAGKGFWYGRHFLARAYLPLSNWLGAFEGLPGAVVLTLRVSPDRLLSGISSDSLVFTSNAMAIAIFATILLLFLLAEYSAARTGRSIIRGILDDVKGLAVAAKRFGEGDLSHRIETRGDDELGTLSASFNIMAENIEQNQQLLLEKERLEEDLALARGIQQRMLPQSPPILSGLDVAGLSVPSREVGGDLFYFLPVSGGRLGLTIGDVSGKSVPAALLMSNVLAALKSEARLIEREDEILTHLNRLIVDQVEPGRFVTFFYGVIDRVNGTLSYACAGHNPPLKMRANGHCDWLSEAGAPLGILPDTRYEAAVVRVELGDVIVLYSDGVTEAHRPLTEYEMDAAEEPLFFEDRRLEAIVRDNRERSAAEIVRAIVDAVHSFTGGLELSDDLTLVVVKIVDAC